MFAIDMLGTDMSFLNATLLMCISVMTFSIKAHSVAFKPTLLGF